MRESREAIRRARIHRVAGIRALEAAASARRPDDSLMERAGHAIATAAIAMTAERSGPVIVLAGPGNNGGDALVAARVLQAHGVDVRVGLLDESRAYAGDAAKASEAWRAAGGMAVDPLPLMASAALIVDGLFGIGFGRAPTGRARDWIEAVNTSGNPVLAIDVPSGVDADTGAVAEIAIHADRTITFIGRKVGLETGAGLDHCGDVVVDRLGIEDDPTVDDAGTLNRPALFEHAWKPRRADSHKGSYGSVAVVGGHDGMVGAALLASRMSLHAGAGRVYVRLMAQDGPGFDVVQPELMLRSSLDGVDATAVAIGPGLGDDDAAIAEIAKALAMDAALVIDADALNAIAKHEALGVRLAARRGQGLPLAVLTPHPLEAARLLQTDAKTVQRDRVGSALRLSRQTASIVVLKGAGSVIADPSGTWVVNRTGNPALATGGTGDVLCGLVAALLAQGMPPLDAARAATWLHGRAADDLVEAGLGPVGIAASELIPAIRAALNRLGRRGA